MSSGYLSETQTGIQSWIDFPFNGAYLESGQVEVLAHTRAASTGLARVELRVNGSVVATDEAITGETTLQTSRLMWSPSADGLYTITVIGQDSQGDWGIPAEIQIHIGKKPADPVVTKPLHPPVSNSIIEPEIEPDTPLADDLYKPDIIDRTRFVTLPVFGTPLLSADTVYYRGTGCGDMEVRIEDQILQTAGTEAVSIRYRLVDKENGEAGEWEEKEMTLKSGSLTDTVWEIIIKPEEDISGFSSYASAWIEFMFMAIDPNGTKSESTHYADLLTLEACHTNTPVRIEKIRINDQLL
ncbi:MAG TPA: Ig-like domain-containing protein [bacterium]|nr:Ig-like domain-containing protein [bacterium]